MSDALEMIDQGEAIARLIEALGEGKLSPDAAANIRDWLSQPRYRDYEAEVRRHIAEGKWRELDDAFWTVIPFGTGGRRGRMYPIGCNAINDRTIGESAAGLAAYVREALGEEKPLACGIAYDTRHRSRHFAELCARIMAAAGFTVYFLDGYRSTPQLSFLVRYKSCDCGIMVTASHNPPSDNAVKVYWSGGVQVLPPHDKGIIERVMSVGDIDAGESFEALVAAGRVVLCTEEVDAAFLEAIRRQQFPGPRQLKIIYSPLHGVGASAVPAALADDGFADVELFGPHAEPSGDFPNVPGHVSNPENPRVFDAIIDRARQSGAELILATDPDCDRIGCAAPLSGDPAGPWATFNGNQIAALLADYLLGRRQAAGALTGEHYVVKTLVTTELVRRIADAYGVRTRGDLLVGFKWIGGTIDEEGPERFVFGCEESHGYLAGDHVRDKDGVAAAMHMAELAAQLKAQGKTLFEKLDALMTAHGLHVERLENLTMEGSAGMERMKALMTSFRERPPQSLGGIPVAAVRDYFHQKTIAGGQQRPLAGPQGDLVIVDLAEPGNYVAVRPSGTEPKVKFYLFAYLPPEESTDLAAARDALAQRLDAVLGDLRAIAAAV